MDVTVAVEQVGQAHVEGHRQHEHVGEADVGSFPGFQGRDFAAAPGQAEPLQQPRGLVLGQLAVRAQAAQVLADHDADRLRRWTADGTWDRILDEAIVKDDAVGTVEWVISADSSHVRAPPARRGGLGKGGCRSDPVEALAIDGEALGRSRGGLAGTLETIRKQLARDLVGEIRETDARLAKLTAQMAQTITEHGSRLPEVAGIGPVVAARLLGRTSRASRFPTSAVFASYAGVAPGRDCQRRPGSTPVAPRRRPPTQLRTAHRCLPLGSAGCRAGRFASCAPKRTA